MVERGDLIGVHEPFCTIADFGETDVDGRPYSSANSLLSWLCDSSEAVFVKDTTDRRHQAVLEHRRFLAEAQHTFLIRRPAEIAASYFALRPHMKVAEVGVEALHELYLAVCATGRRPVVIDSDDLIARPAATMQAYCEAVGLPFIASALSWEPGPRPEWQRFAEWHVDASLASGFRAPTRSYADTVESSQELARFAAHHRPFYERLSDQRLVVAAS